MAKASQTSKKTGNTKEKTSAKDGNTKTKSNKAKTSSAKAGVSKKSTSTKTAKNNTQSANEAAEEEMFLGGEIAVWVIGAVMLILELANFGLCGAVSIVSDFFFGLFGIIQYVVPLAVLISAFFLYVNEFKPRAVHKVVFGFIALLGIGMIAQMTEGIPDKYNLEAFYNGGFGENGEHFGGGIICGSLAFILNKAVGSLGTYIIILLSIIICVVLFAEISLIDVIRSITGEVIKARDDEYDDDDIYDDETEYEAADRRDAGRRRSRRNRKDDIYDEIAVEDFSEARKSKNDKAKNVDNLADISQTGRKGSILESISVLPDDPSKGIIPDSNVTKLPDGEEVHEITVDFPVNLPGENMDSFEVDEVDKAEVRSASNNRKKVKRNIVPVVLPDSNESKSAGGNNLDENIDKMDLFPDSYDGYDDISMPSIADINGISDVAGSNHAKTSSCKVRKTSVKNEAVDDGVIGEMLTDSEKEAVMNMENKTAKEEKNMSAKEVGSSDSEYKFPPLELLKQSKSSNNMRDDTVRENAVKLQEVLKSFGVNVTMTNYSCGPSVTRYEMVPEQGVKVSKITGLADDIMMNLAAQSIRIEAPIPGKSAVGIEIPNGKRIGVGFRELIDTEKFIKHPSKIAVAVGKDIEGNVVVEDIAKMPHLLIAGATGSGKSVCTNTLIMSILYKARPDEVKLILVDPKQVELKVYNGIPHLLTPVVTDPKKAAGALNWAVAEMTDRYQKFAECNVRNIQGYNEKVEDLKKSGDIEDVTIEKMPQIVIIVDELADLMMVAKAEVEEAIVRLAQLARAAGIHLVIATQRPSVDVVTGLIKANVPSRIALSVSSGIDSRTIIDTVGAEKLLGNGDMLFYPTTYPKPLRVQGAYISDDEVVNVVEFLKANNGETTYSEEMTNKITSSGSAMAGSSGDGASGNDKDEYFVQAGKFIIEKNKASIGMLQRMFKIGFNRAARIMDQLSEAGVVGPEVGTKPREVLMTEEQFEEYVDEYF